MNPSDGNISVHFLMEQPGFWCGKGPYSDMVLSSRIRIARNMASIPFPGRMSGNDITFIHNALNDFVSSSVYRSCALLNINSLKGEEKRFLRERNIITYEMEINNNSLVIINHDDDFSIMVNDGDHFRIQVMRPGLQLEECLRLGDKVDDELNAFIPYAFLPELGYLTSNPGHLGTGVKLSVIMHLPLISLKKKFPLIAPRLKSAGIIMEGTMGEGNRPLGSLYHIASNMNLGYAEQDILDSTDEGIHRIMSLEDSLRDECLAEGRMELEDRIFRSIGLVRYSRRMAYGEALEHLSNIRLGIILAIVHNADVQRITDLMVRIQWFHLQMEAGHTFTDSVECDEFRAEYLRKTFEEMESRHV